MKYFLYTLAVLFCTVPGFSQNKSSRDKPKLLQDTSLTQRIRNLEDSLKENFPSLQDSMERERIRKDAEKNLTALVELQEKRESKMKTGAIIRIAIGAILVIVMFIGLMRRRKRN